MKKLSIFLLDHNQGGRQDDKIAEEDAITSPPQTESVLGQGVCVCVLNSALTKQCPNHPASLQAAPTLNHSSLFLRYEACAFISVMVTPLCWAPDCQHVQHLGFRTEHLQIQHSLFPPHTFENYTQNSSLSSIYHNTAKMFFVMTEDTSPVLCYYLRASVHLGHQQSQLYKPFFVALIKFSSELNNHDLTQLPNSIGGKKSETKRLINQDFHQFNHTATSQQSKSRVVNIDAIPRMFL